MGHTESPPESTPHGLACTRIHSALCREGRCRCTRSRAHPLGACGGRCSPSPTWGHACLSAYPTPSPGLAPSEQLLSAEGSMLKGLGAHPRSTPPPATRLGSGERVDTGLCPQALPLPRGRAAEPLQLDQGRGPPTAVQRKAAVPIPSGAGAPRSSPSSGCVHAHQGPHPLLPASGSTGVHRLGPWLGPHL